MSSIHRPTTFEEAVETVNWFKTNNAFERNQNVDTYLYQHWKQAKFGNARSTTKPSIFHPIDLAKWSAWDKLNGMSSETARSKYLLYVQSLYDSLKK